MARFRLTALVLVLYSLPHLTPTISSSRSPISNRVAAAGTHINTRDQFDEWMSWNADKYRRESDAIAGSNMVDPRLSIAEMNRTRISVSQEGAGDFTTIGEALDSIPLRNTRRVVLEIGPGIYREKIKIPRTMSFVTLLGHSSTDPPTITGNDTASVTGRDGKPLKTFQSATVAVDADYFVAINIKFENSAPHLVGSVGGQGVAIRISGTKAAFYNCSFCGSQDTLYDHKGLHYFSNCFIQGSVDFIFGYGTSLYENCELNSVAEKVASITAQKRSSRSMSSGFSFINSKITGSGTVYLGRAWGDYSRVVFSYTFMDSNVLPQGWSDWGRRIRDARVYYGEYKCSGPGANLDGRVPWARVLSDEEALPFIGKHYVEADTWLLDPSTYSSIDDQH